MVLASSFSQACVRAARAAAASMASISISNTLPWRTLETPLTPSDFRAPSIALPWGSRTPGFRVTVTRVFIGPRLTPRSGRVRSRRLRHHRIDRRSVTRGAKLGGEVGIAQFASDRRKRLQMVGARGFRRDQQKDQIDRQPVQRLEVDRPLEPREHAENAPALSEFAVRNRDAVADARRSEALALQDRIEDFARRQPGNLRGAIAQFLQRLLLAIDAKRRDHGIRGQ